MTSTVTVTSSHDRHPLPPDRPAAAGAARGRAAPAPAAGVTRLITIGTGLADDEAAVAVCQRQAEPPLRVGVHPNYSARGRPERPAPPARSIRRSVGRRLGEMGLDYHHTSPAEAHQRQIFEFQLQLATELGRPSSSTAARRSTTTSRS